MRQPLRKSCISEIVMTVRILKIMIQQAVVGFYPTSKKM